MGVYMHNLKESLAGAILAGGASFLLWASISRDAAAVGKAWENGYAERVIGTIKQEEVELSEYRTFADALRQL